MMALAEFLSPDRMSTYLRWSRQDTALSEQLYGYNLTLSAQFYIALHVYEVVFRNRLDTALVRAFGPDWITDRMVLREDYQRQCVDKAVATILRAGKTSTHSSIIAELNLGFWTSLLGPRSHQLWSVLRPAFQTRGLQRSTLSGKCQQLRLLRNRIAHLEPILQLPLASLFRDLLTITGWGSPEAATWLLDRVSITLLDQPLLIRDAASGQHHVDPALLDILNSSAGSLS